MEILQSIWDRIFPAMPAAAGIIGLIIVLFVARRIIERRFMASPGHQFRRQVATMIILFAGLLAIILLLPLSDASRGQLLNLVGILLTAAIALSSTTFVGNAMAGLMLRAVRNFRPGDFIRVGEHFGRVSERGLFHVEIQTEDRDLTTLPNLYLVTNPVKVVRESGTLVSADVSLGYDVPRSHIESLLIEAAKQTELQEPFVYLMDLGDFSVTYRVAGLLTEVKQILSTRSRLRTNMLEILHRAGIEIVSPTFMNTRAIPPDKRFIPLDSPTAQAKDSVSDTAPEAVAFDKAEEAASLETLREKLGALGKEQEALKDQLKDAPDENERSALKSQIESLENRLKRLAELIKHREEKSSE
jgi:small conductance mechanosensitive channel